MSQISEAWDRILKWLGVHAPKTLDTLNPGASSAEIDEIERFLQIQLPEDVREFYRICNGQHTKTCAMLPRFYYLLSLREMREQWELEMRVLAEDPQLSEEVPFDQYSEIVQSASPKVRACYWHVKWIPIAYCLTGDLYCVDLAPTAQGQHGQIIEFWHDADTRDLIAPSLSDFLSTYAADLERDRYVYDSYTAYITEKPSGG